MKFEITKWDLLQIGRVIYFTMGVLFAISLYLLFISLCVCGGSSEKWAYICVTFTSFTYGIYFARLNIYYKLQKRRKARRKNV